MTWKASNAVQPALRALLPENAAVRALRKPSYSGFPTPSLRRVPMQSAGRGRARGTSEFRPDRCVCGAVADTLASTEEREPEPIVAARQSRNVGSISAPRLRLVSGRSRALHGSGPAPRHSRSGRSYRRRPTQRLGSRRRAVGRAQASRAVASSEMVASPNRCKYVARDPPPLPDRLPEPASRRHQVGDDVPRAWTRRAADHACTRSTPHACRPARARCPAGGSTSSG